MPASNVVRQVNRGEQHSTATTTTTALVGPDSVQRSVLEQFIADRYLTIHNARLHAYMPILVGVQQHHQFTAGFGIRPGCVRPFFLEQYLENPIEQQVSQVTSGPVIRDQLVEVGNLVVSPRGPSVETLIILSQVLSVAGYRWMVFTATCQVERLMKRLGFQPSHIATADPAKLKENQNAWGNYYANQPRVMLGDLEVASKTVAHSSRLKPLYDSLEPLIRDTADRLMTLTKTPGAWR